MIKKLQKMPPNALVGFASHDNNEYEIQGWASTISLIDKKDINLEDLSNRDIQTLEDHPQTWVSIRC